MMSALMRSTPGARRWIVRSFTFPTDPHWTKTMTKKYNKTRLMQRHNDKCKEIATNNLFFFFTKASVYRQISDCTVFNTNKNTIFVFNKEIFWGPTLHLTHVF